MELIYLPAATDEIPAKEPVNLLLASEIADHSLAADGSLSHGERVGVRGVNLSIARSPAPGASRRPLPTGEVNSGSRLSYNSVNGRHIPHPRPESPAPC
jgi:hypothetical protein